VTKEAANISTLHKCMACGKGLSRRSGKKKNTFWWGCSGFPECKQTYSDTKGKPNYSEKKEKSESGQKNKNSENKL
jgi:DNA topoisomerase-3